MPLLNLLDYVKKEETYPHDEEPNNLGRAEMTSNQEDIFYLHWIKPSAVQHVFSVAADGWLDENLHITFYRKYLSLKATSFSWPPHTI